MSGHVMTSASARYPAKKASHTRRIPRHPLRAKCYSQRVAARGIPNGIENTPLEPDPPERVALWRVRRSLVRRRIRLKPAKGERDVRLHHSVSEFHENLHRWPSAGARAD